MGTKKVPRSTRNVQSVVLTWLFNLVKPCVIVICLVAVSRFIIVYNSESAEKPEPSVRYNSSPKCWLSCLSGVNHFRTNRTYQRVFERLGFEFVNGTNGDDWYVLWSSEYPHSIENPSVYLYVKKLKPHQRVNHFPGMNFVTSKSFMSSRNRDIKAILPGFILPAQINKFKAYIKENPQARFLSKSEFNRGIKLVNITSMNLDETRGYFQLFMEKPLLIDDRAMDISVYFLISSIDPIRIYRYTQHVHLRFCEEPYHPFDPLNLNKYVISDTRNLAFQMPSLKGYDDHGFSYKLAIEAYLTAKGFNVTEMWNKIDDAVIQLMVNNEKNFIAKVNINCLTIIL